MQYSNDEVLRKEKIISYFSKCLKLKTVLALKRSLWFDLNLYIILPSNFQKSTITKKNILKIGTVKNNMKEYEK